MTDLQSQLDDIQAELDLIRERCERIPDLADSAFANPGEAEDNYDVARNISGALQLILDSLEFAN